MKFMDPQIDMPDEDFSEYEQVYLKLSRAFKDLGKEHWGLHCICTVRYDADSQDDLQTKMHNAWRRLLAEYPGLRMVPMGIQKHYDCLDMTSLAEQTFFARKDLTARTVIADANLSDLPALYFLPTSMEVVLLIQHWRTDGLGACMLLDRLFEILGGQNDSDTLNQTMEHALPSPSLLIAAGADDHEDDEMRAYAREYIDNFHSKAVNTGGLPFQGTATTSPAQTTHLDVELSERLSDSMTRSCKRNQISVSAAIHTSLAQTVQSYVPSLDCESGFTTVIAVNMRPYLPASYNTKAHACQTFVTSITPTVRYEARFLDSARTLTHEYRNWWTERYMLSLRSIYKYNLSKISSPAAETTVPPKPPSGVTISSLGVIERHLRGEYGPRLSVEKFHFGVSMMTRQMVLYAWTFKGHLTLSLSYNEAYYSDSMAQDVLNRIQSNLKSGLEVE